MITYGIWVTKSAADRRSATVVARNPGVAVALAVKINSKTVTRNLLCLFEYTTFDMLRFFLKSGQAFKHQEFKNIVSVLTLP